MGWLRVAGSLKSQVSFAEYSLFYRALLQKRLIILRSLLIVATPYGLRASCLSPCCHAHVQEYSIEDKQEALLQIHRALLQTHKALLQTYNKTGQL